MGALVVTVVVVAQALAFADGGLTALGYNVLNMAIVTSFGGYAIFRLLRRVLPSNATGVIVATGLAAGLSVVLSAMTFSIEWLFGATAPVPFDTVFGSMVGVHLLIGIGEAVLSALAVGAALASRPDLVHAARDLDRAALADRPAMGMRGFVIGGVLVALLFAVVVSQFAAPAHWRSARGCSWRSATPGERLGARRPATARWPDRRWARATPMPCTSTSTASCTGWRPRSSWSRRSRSS